MSPLSLLVTVSLYEIASCLVEHGSGVGVLDKAVELLELLAAGPASLGDLVAHTGMPKATAHRLAVALEHHGLARRDDQQRFVLGARFVELGRAAAEQIDLAAIARPIMVSLRNTTGESVQLYVRSGQRRMCVASLDSPNELRTIVPVGASLPLDKGSAGKVLDPRRPASRRMWVESIAEREAGVASVSAPVVDSSGAVLAAISLSGPIERVGRQPGRRFGPAVVDAATALSSRLR
jgi:DNA-binding IclR family transcriptional regulator